MTSSAPQQLRRLLIVTHYFPAHGGGVEGIARDIAHHLLELAPSLEIHWCASDCDPLLPQRERLFCHALPAFNELERRTGIPYPLPLPKAVCQLWRQVAQCEVVHLHDFSYASNALAALFCHLQNKPYIITQHIGMVPYKNSALRFVLSLLNGTLGRWSLRRAARVVFYNRRIERYFGSFVSRRRRAFLPNGVDSTKFFPVAKDERDALRRELGVESNEPTVAFVGRFVEKKGVPFLLELSKQFPGARWLLAGRGPLDPGDNVQPNLKVWRDRSGVQIGDLMRASDVLVLPSRGEGFPLVVQEAVACGAAVLAERELALSQPESSQMLELQPLGRPDDLERWTNKLREMLDAIEANPEEAEAKRQQRAEWANREWNWTQCAREYLHLFNSTLEEQTR